VNYKLIISGLQMNYEWIIKSWMWIHVNEFHSSFDHFNVGVRDIFFHFGMFTTSFNLVIFWVWCMSFYEILLSHMTLRVVLIFFWCMWAHCSWSYSPICIMFVYGIMTGETNQQHSTWHNWKGDLLVGHLHICHLF